ncbi:MAG: tRNA dihydrouridine synthase [Planctomycetota bacterium]
MQPALESRTPVASPRGAPALPFTAPWLLAPMEGVTEPCFRDLLLEANAPGQLGGAFTEFARVVATPLGKRSLAEHLGTRRFDAPVGLQLMGSDLDALARTVENAVELGVPLIDLNFGCPAKGAIRTCAGSALLREPTSVERLVRRCVDAARTTPVTAKIRAGYDDASNVEELARAVEAGGAALLTVHCRTRVEAYQDEVDWTRIARAVGAVSIPVCGNGGVNVHADLERMRRETGCALVMVGRAALGDPWIFSDRRVSRAEAARFLLEYGARLRSTNRSLVRGAAGRIKQLLRYWTAGDLVGNERESWMRESDPELLFDRLRGVASGG